MPDLMLIFKVSRQFLLLCEYTWTYLSHLAVPTLLLPHHPNRLQSTFLNINAMYRRLPNAFGTSIVFCKVSFTLSRVLSDYLLRLKVV